ncbi:MAG TPA: sulfate adenylyltransferase, partial [Methyloversatilis sp.]
PASVAAALPAADRVELSVAADATGIALDATGSILTVPADLQEDRIEQIVETLRRAGRVA